LNGRYSLDALLKKLIEVPHCAAFVQVEVCAEGNENPGINDGGCATSDRFVCRAGLKPCNAYESGFGIKCVYFLIVFERREAWGCGLLRTSSQQHKQQES
jgi:hypothetical protein